MKSSHPNAEIDWPQVHARLAAATANTREIFNPSAERTERLLEDRARRLALPLASHQEVGESLELLVFSLSGEHYGIETRHVRELVGSSDLTAVPGVPEAVAGVANLRGQVLVVFDIRTLVGLMAQAAPETPSILVCGATDADFGLVIDAAHGVVRVPASEISTDAIEADAASTSIVRGLTRDALIVLDGAELFGDPRLFASHAQRP